jgi:hypothetical protein
MAGFNGIRAIASAQDAGNYLYASFRKQATQASGAGVWFDLSMSPGNPAPNYYIGSPNIFVPLKQSTDGGLRHGGAVNALGKKKYLRKLMAFCTVSAPHPMGGKLLDYIGFYGFIDESNVDEQFLDNTTPLPRYEDGKGVQMMPVVVAGHTGGQTFTVNYTNQDGVTGRITKVATMGTQTLNGTILHSQAVGAAYVNNGPFLPLQEGDTGVRSVQSVTVGGVGDVGLFALVLVKPLATFTLFGVNDPTEVDYLTDMAALPEIKDDAYLNFIVMPNGSLNNAPIIGIIETTWS